MVYYSSNKLSIYLNICMVNFMNEMQIMVFEPNTIRIKYYFVVLLFNNAFTINSLGLLKLYYFCNKVYIFVFQQKTHEETKENL